MLPLTRTGVGVSTTGSAAVLWLATGRRVVMLRWVCVILGFLALLSGVGTSADLAPGAALTQDLQVPKVVQPSSSVHPQLFTPMQAEEFLGLPLLRSSMLRDGNTSLGIWGASFSGPFGRTFAIFQVFATPRKTWLTVLQLRTQRPLLEPSWDFLDSRRTQVNGHLARLFHESVSITVAWQVSPTAAVSLSEDLENLHGASFGAGARPPRLLDEDTFLILADSLQPRGLVLGPFHLGSPWS